MASASPSSSAARSLFSPLRRVYALHGQDDRQKDEALRTLIEAAVDPGSADFDLEVLEAESADAERILSAAGMAPLGDRQRLVIVRGAELYRRKERAADADRLADGLSRLGTSTCVALRVAAADDEDRRGKTVLSPRLDRAIAAAGVFMQCRALTEDALIECVRADARAAGKRIEDGAARRLIRAVHGDRRALDNELEKAICYIGDGDTITLAVAENVASYDPEDVMFGLVDCVCQRNADGALHLLRELVRHDARPQSVAGRLVALLARQFRLIYQARELAARGMGPARLRTLPADVSADLPSESSIAAMAWRARDLFDAARGWTTPDIVSAIGLLVECDLANKGGELGSEDVLTNVELLIVRLCQRT